MKQSRHRLSFQPILKPMAAGALVLATGLCLAGDIYRWVDEQGHTHMADAVPERYKAGATKIDARRFEVSPSDRLAAEARAARERERQAALDAERARAEAAERRASAPESGIFFQPTAKADKAPATQCDRLWQEYFKSQECFAPYFTRRGIKAEAFEHCKEVVSPDQQCGQARKIGSD